MRLSSWTATAVALGSATLSSAQSTTTTGAVVTLTQTVLRVDHLPTVLSSSTVSINSSISKSLASPTVALTSTAAKASTTATTSATVNTATSAPTAAPTTASVNGASSSKLAQAWGVLGAVAVAFGASGMLP